MSTDLILANGRFFDGCGSPSAPRHVRIRDGRIAEISAAPLDATGAQSIDCTGQWVMPGFLDMHTHYDAEVLAAPGLCESVRHGVTTILMGSCSLSTVLCGPEDCGASAPGRRPVSTSPRWRTALSDPTSRSSSATPMCGLT